MNAFVLFSGSAWEIEALNAGLLRLEHRGPASPIVRAPGWELWGFGDSPIATCEADLNLWTWGLDPVDHRRLLERRRSDERTSQIPEDFPAAVALFRHSGLNRIEIYNGARAFPPLVLKREGPNLFVAPEAKAFPGLDDSGSLATLEPGHSVRIDPSRPECEIVEATMNWQPVPLTQLSYEDCRNEVVRLLEEAMAAYRETCPEPVAIALSGGLDSSLVALLVHRAGIRGEAFTVWFDAPGEATPPDLVGARLTAASLAMPLHELRIGPEDIEGLARETVYLTESTQWRQVETGTYVLRLSRELRRRGIDRLLTGVGADGQFGGRVFPRQLGEDFQKSLAMRRRERYIMETLPAALGFRIWSPFQYPALDAFTLSLPQEFQLESSDGKPRGKRILRDAFRPFLVSPLALEQKDFPFRTSGAEALFKAQWGSRKRREARYERWRRKMLPHLHHQGESSPDTCPR